MKPRPRLQEFLLKKLNFTLLCLAVVYSFRLALFLAPALHAAPKTPTPSSKSSRTVSKPVKQSGVKSSKKSSTRKKITSRSKKPRQTAIHGQRTIESARVLEIQNALAAAGYYKQDPNGQWDESTRKAMSAYQQNNGFLTTGKPDALSLKKLGL
ncbi:MAG: peptidoglycan-binding protein [Acidobacteria bacterium]|nr:peptidoglycan-binding protein [Acidobacteriota bacterium]